jgi:hypothetical protein
MSVCKHLVVSLALLILKNALLIEIHSNCTGDRYRVTNFEK